MDKSLNIFKNLHDLKEFYRIDDIGERAFNKKISNVHSMGLDVNAIQNSQRYLAIVDNRASLMEYDSLLHYVTTAHMSLPYIDGRPHKSLSSMVFIRYEMVPYTRKTESIFNYTSVLSVESAIRHFIGNYQYGMMGEEK
jgi:hypothetical protein